MDIAGRDELVRDLARGVVARVAPQEMPTFRVQSDSYFRAPEAALKRAGERGRDEALGFGAAEAAALVTPAALAIATTVIAFLFDIVREAMKTEATSALRERVKGMIGSGRSAAAGTASGAPTLTAEQISLVRQTALEKALQLRLSEDQATLLADAVVGSLSLSRP